MTFKKFKTAVATKGCTHETGTFTSWRGEHTWCAFPRNLRPNPVGWIRYNTMGRYWEVNADRGVTGYGVSLEEADKNESDKYQLAYEAHTAGVDR